MDIHEFDAVLSSKDSPSSEELGGMPVMRQLASEFVKSGHADRLANVLCHTTDMRADYLNYAVAVLRENPYPLVVASVGKKLADMEMSRREAMSAQDALLSRARQTDSQLDNEMASECLAAAFLLASEAQAPQSALVAALDRVESGDNFLLVRRVALLAGLAWHWGHARELEVVLERLAADKEAGEQAAFELGMIHIDRALSSQDKESLFARLNDAAKWFEAAEDVAPEMPEATAFRGTVRALMLFCEDAPAETIEQHVVQACEAASERFQYLDNSSLRKWLRPRLDAQTSWYELTSALQGLSKQMSERSWLRALPVLQQIANLRSTLVSLATDSGDALRSAVTNRLASGFAAREGLRAHLQDWIDDAQTDEANRQEAATLLAAVDNLRADPGKAGPLASEGGLASGSEPEDPIAKSASALPGGFLSPFNRMQEDCFLQLTSQLQSHVDYRGTVANDVNSLIAFLIRFSTHCLDVGFEIAKPFLEFLFRTGGNLPLERELQAAMFHALHLGASNFQTHQIHREAHDVSRGRADLAITCADWRMIIEVKRESSDASREGISQYLGQAAAYLLTGPRIGFLVVLDLCSQKQWPLTLADNCWVESVKGPGDSEPRIIVVWRIPGMRPVPSAITTPSANPKPKTPKRRTTKGKVASKP
ncbi:hypothetical protein [Caballeronia sordidicola]|uniref:hypothetical protein n=1 Tax=Caballeronia sordidicola TaxID=196367 RepID=UPI0004D03073|nr:hypothetical protein [Caballeronia sordidicola]